MGAESGRRYVGDQDHALLRRMGVRLVQKDEQAMSLITRMLNDIRAAAFVATGSERFATDYQQIPRASTTWTITYSAPRRWRDYRSMWVRGKAR